MLVGPDSFGEIKSGRKNEALTTWKGYEGKNRKVAGAERLHICIEMSTSSQALGACMTPKPSLGGRAWPSFAVNENIESPTESEKALAVWLNTTIGLIGRWYVSSRQQPGRSMLSISRIGDIPTIDIRLVGPEKLMALASVFEKHKRSIFQPAYLIHKDKERQMIDELILCNILNLPKYIIDPLQTVRKQWCDEPSVRGHKK